jgi:hypothetical protein
MLQAQSVIPSKILLLDFKSTANGEPTYTVNYKNKAVVLESAMGIKLKEKPALVANFKLQGTENTTFNASWEVLGEQASIVNHYN